MSVSAKLLLLIVLLPSPAVPRMVALCTAEGVDISRWMIEQGQAIAFRKYSLDYVADEDPARISKVGMWAGESKTPPTSGVTCGGGRPVRN